MCCFWPIHITIAHIKISANYLMSLFVFCTFSVHTKTRHTLFLLELGALYIQSNQDSAMFSTTFSMTHKDNLGIFVIPTHLVPVQPLSLSVNKKNSPIFLKHPCSTAGGSLCIYSLLHTVHREMCCCAFLFFLLFFFISVSSLNHRD